ncbi:MAG: hypothetical protein E7214_02165 [Clostridium sp.]|nr:hypothetical protein [Clostridium sp.]
MKKIGIIYFSGTGNTEFIARVIKEEVEKNNIEADLINIEKDRIECENYDSLIIGSPVYVERYPELLFEYIKNISEDYKGRCMLFTTQASCKMITAFQHFLNRVKYLNVTYCAVMSMPNNFYNFMFDKVPDEEKENMILNSTEMCKEAVNNFLNGKYNFYPVKRSKIIAIDLIYKIYYKFFIKSITKNIKIDTSKCIKCKLCEKKCPVSAIEIRDQVIFKKKCLLCQRCMSNCPKDAFYYKDKKYIQYKLK